MPPNVCRAGTEELLSFAGLSWLGFSGEGDTPDHQHPVPIKLPYVVPKIEHAI
jgi:hypothetical protein